MPRFRSSPAPSQLIPLLAALSAVGCADQALTKFNADPQAFIMSHQDGTPVVVGTAVDFSGSVSDANHDAVDLVVSWSAGGRQLCPPGPPGTDGTTTCTAAVEAEESLLQLTVQDPGGAKAAASAQLDLLTGTPPRAAILAPGADQRLYSDYPANLEGVVEDEEDRSEELSAWWEADGELLAQVTPASSGRVSGSTTFTEGSHELVLVVEDSNGVTAQDSVSLTVGGPNVLPECAIDEPEDGATIELGGLALFRGTATDADIPAEQLQVSWSSNRDGVLDGTPPTAAGEMAFGTEDLSGGVHTITLTATDEVGGACTDQIILQVSQPPTLSIEEPGSGSVFTSEDSVSFAAQVGDAEDDPQDIEVRWESDLDGELHASNADSTGAVAFSTDALSPGNHVVTVTATDTGGLQTSTLLSLQITDCGAISWYGDDDGDGYGQTADRYDGCSPPSNYVSDDGDCDDDDASIHPGASELCSSSGVDDDCDGTADEDDAADASTWYTDADGDGYGQTSTAATACSQPSGSVATDGDCDDTDSSINPGESEICGDSTDEDCDGLAPTCQEEVDLADADARLYGQAADDQAGIAVCLPGDVDGDGTDDVLVGAWQNDDGGSDAGAAYLFFGPISGDHGLGDADALLTGAATDDYLGRAVAGAGDLDGDGTDDLLIGAYGDDSAATDAGAALLFLGPVSGALSASDADATLLGEASSDAAGIAVAGAGDISGDGTDDLLIGAWNEDSGGSNAGMAYLVAGPVSGDFDLADADARLIGEASSDLAGGAVAGVGDANGDGVDDLLVGAYAEDSGGNAAGSAYLILGPVSGDLDLRNADLQLVGANAQDFAGRAVAGPGDVNGDGIDDLLVGASGNDGNGTAAGAAYLVHGATSGLSGSSSLSSANAALQGESTLSYAGRSVGPAGDINGDGNFDVLIGAHGDDGGGTAAGAAYIAFGPLSGTVVLDEPEYKLVGESAGDEAGFSVSGGGDVDADGTPDLLVGAYLESTVGADAGAAYLVLGSSLP